MLNTLYSFLIAAFLILCVSCLSNKGILMEIKNCSAHDILNISIAYRGGVEKIDRLKGGADISMRIKPSGESSIIVAYEEEGVKYQKDIDVYIEPTVISF